MPWYVLRAAGTDLYLGHEREGHRTPATALVGLQAASPWLGLDAARSEGVRARGIVRAEYVPVEVAFDGRGRDARVRIVEADDEFPDL